MTNLPKEVEERFDAKFADYKDDWGVSVIGYGVTTNDMKTFIAQELQLQMEQDIALIKETCPQYESPLGTVYRVGEHVFDAMRLTPTPDTDVQGGCYGCAIGNTALEGKHTCNLEVPPTK